jgi:hypothetical protein
MYTLPLALAAASFFSLHLLGKPCRVETDGLLLESGSEIWCTASGQIRTDYPDARKVYHENAERLALFERERLARPQPQRQAEALDWLREQIGGGRPACELNPRHQKLGAWEGLTAQSSVWWSQPGMFSHGFLFSAMAESAAGAEASPQRSIVIAVWEGGTSRLLPHEDWIRAQCAAGSDVLVLDVAGVGALAPNAINGKALREKFGTIHKLNMDLFWLGDSIAALRTYDVLRAIEFARRLAGAEDRRISLYGEGTFSVYTEWAEALTPRPLDLTVAEPWESIAAWVRSEYYDNTGISEFVLPGMLRQFDLPDLREWRNER